MIIDTIRCNKTADWLVDMGYEGGDGGGEIIAVGTPEQVAQDTKLHTGRFLKPLLNQTTIWQLSNYW